MSRVLSSMALSILLLTLPTSARAAEMYDVDATHSNIGFKVKHMGVSSDSLPALDDDDGSVIIGWSTLGELIGGHPDPLGDRLGGLLAVAPNDGANAFGTLLHFLRVLGLEESV